MTKTPCEVEPPRQLTKAEREARKAFRQVDAEKAMTEHEITQKAFSKNRERLKAERLAREAELKAKGEMSGHALTANESVRTLLDGVDDSCDGYCLGRRFGPCRDLDIRLTPELPI
jgi:hypothetical protein